VEVRLEPGEKVRGRVVTISDDLVYVDLGGKTEATIELSEFVDEAGTRRVAEGDEVEAFFVSVQDGVRKLTTLIHGYSALQLNTIRDAWEHGQPITGDVKREVKGGFEVSAGGVRCFCPFSQIDLKGGREGGVYLGQTLPFKVLDFKEDGRNIILSRRAYLEEQRRRRIEELRKSLSVGIDVTGTVTSLQNFGAFVDIGGVDGLIPLSEFAWGKTEQPQDVVSLGEQVTARIISLDWDNNRMTLSLKALQADPWHNAAERYPVGSCVEGTIVRLAPFGAFVSLEPGIDGLIHISNLGAGRRINHPREAAEVGQKVECYVLAVDASRRRISLSMQLKKDREKVKLPSVGETVEGVVEKVMPFGVFVKGADGFTGLIPQSESGTPRGSDLAKLFPVGDRVQAAVLEVDEERGKVTLSRKAASEKAEHEDYKRYRETQKSEQKGNNSIGTFGELLKAKLDERKLKS
jgi:small subunit ribosomal protein S1